nr:beta-microseminoprotein J1-like [Danio rerio]|eukprot:XP_017213099.1 beta-microseminoprotein J1-like [Danio rerio]
MASLTFVLIVCVIMSLSESCFIELLEPGATNCTDRTDNSCHPIGSSWTNTKCIRCDCSATEMSCCETMGTVTNHTEVCIVTYNYTTCTFKVFHPDDSSFNCEFSAILK